ncbi:hypothetical protein ACLOJK_034799 [Asimina triloba]
MVHHRGALMVLHLLRLEVAAKEDPLHRRPKLSSTARARHRRHHVEHGAPPPSTAMNDAHKDAVADLPRPTTTGTSLPRSEPFITTDDEHISDRLRPQADVHHNGHTRQIFLARPISAFIFPNLSVVIFGTSKRLTSRSMSSIMSTRSSRSRNCQDRTQRTAKIVCPCCPTTLAASSHLVRMLLDRTRHHLARPMPARRHRLARSLPAGRHSACRQGRRGRVAPTANHGDADISCRHSYSDRPAIVLDLNRL